jgi:type II secretory pathway pseudopilin PulG
MAGDQVIAGVAAITAYHSARRMLEQAEPRMVDGKLVSSYQLPRSDSAQVYVAVVGVLAAVAIPAFIKYIRKSKAIEATESLQKIAAGARAYYQQKRRFPPGGAWTPATPCCRSAAAPKCAPVAADWSGSPWRELRFALADPHYYQYRFTSKGRGKRATFVAEARGDLDCDGETSSFKILGAVDPGGAVMTKGPVIENEIE